VFYSVVNQNFLRDISEYVLSEKDNLALDFVRNSPMNNTLVKIDNEFVLQRQIRCLLEPEWYLEDVVSIILFILNNNTHATDVHICNVIFWTNIGSQYLETTFVSSSFKGLSKRNAAVVEDDKFLIERSKQMLNYNMVTELHLFNCQYHRCFQ
jgi:hypothetical protein